MRDKDKDIISSYLGVQPLMIDSSLVSAQDRKRYYWTNIENIEQPQDKGLILEDVILKDVPEKFYYNCSYVFHGDDKKIIATVGVNGHDILKRFSNPKFKAPTLTAVCGGNQQKKVFQNERCRKLTPLEYERLQNLPDNYTSGFPDTTRYNVIGNGWTVDVIKHILEHIGQNKKANKRENL